MSTSRYSIVIPVYNRPEEVDELLESLTRQSLKDFEVIIVEDGSSISCEEIVEKYEDRLDVCYFFKENSGQGFSRNYGYQRAKGDWFIVFDSDCLIPPHYLQSVDDFIRENSIDAFGGPDRAHASFSDVQKAISYSMTSIFTTGGIRGRKKHIGTFHPRSFNMGISKEVFSKTGGYILPRKGEDIEFSIRIIENGFKTALIDDAYVYHKRRTTFRQFYKQLHFFGTARINVFRHFKSELKIVHLFPTGFTLGFFISILSGLVSIPLMLTFLGVYLFYAGVIFIDSAIQNKNLNVALKSVFAAFVQLFAYGIGFMKEGLIYLRRG